jgi:hypothetical protein
MNGYRFPYKQFTPLSLAGVEVQGFEPLPFGLVKFII